MYYKAQNSVKMINLCEMENLENMDINQDNKGYFINRLLNKGELSGKNDWWFYLLGIVAAFLGYVLFQMIMMVPLMSAALSNGIEMSEIMENPNLLFNPDATGINRSVLLALMMGMFVFTLLFFWIAVNFLQKKPLTSLITGFEKIRWNRYFFAFGVWAALLIIITLVGYFVSPQEFEIRFDFGKFMILFMVAVIFIPIQTATEEIIFRGYLMQGFGQAFKNAWAPLIITSILFGLLHGSNPEAKAHGLLIMLPYYIFFGAFLGMLTLLDEGLELALGIHCANNLISSLLICSENSVLQTDAIFYTNNENPGGEFGIWIIVAGICFFILNKKYQLTNWKLLLR